jgi:stage II sporulation protein AA (anti-sigma F factor antagonist)
MITCKYRLSKDRGIFREKEKDFFSPVYYNKIVGQAYCPRQARGEKMDIRIKMKGNVLVVAPKGELDHHTASQLRSKIDQAIQEHPVRHLVFDFGGLAFMDSAGIGLVMGRYNQISQMGGKVAVTGCNAAVERILSMAGIFSLALKCDHTASALEQVGSSNGMY